MLRYSLVFALGLIWAGNASAATWAEAFFDEQGKDFGTVARGPTLSHPIRVVNKTSSTVQITNVRVSCGCTSAREGQSTLAPGQETAILISMDTRRFSGPKSVTVFVTFNQTNPTRRDEVRLTVTANARDDISILPESLAIGKVKKGETASGSVNITLLGNQAWEIKEASSESNYVQPKLELVKRQGSEVVYKLTATVRNDTPVGKWYTDIWLQTTNAGAQKVRVPLTVEIEPAVNVSPMTVALGEIKVGAAAERKVVVQALRPFRIVGFKGADKELAVHDNSNESKKVHVLTVTIQPHNTGEMQRVIRVMTDLEGEETIEFVAIAQVVQ
jgi:Protein of unknown function (DUF1573)